MDHYLDPASRAKAFEHNWARLHAPSSRLDLDALALCLRLLPTVDAENDYQPQHQALGRLLLSRIPEEPHDSEHLFVLAELCHSNEAFVHFFVEEYIKPCLNAALVQLSKSTTLQETSDEDVITSREDHVRNAVAFLNLLKYSYWLPPKTKHAIDPTSLGFLVRFVGIDRINEPALDALSALLSLLVQNQQTGILVACPKNHAPLWLQYDHALQSHVLNHPLVDQSWWNRLKTLRTTDFTAASDKIYKVWYQWIVQASRTKTELVGVYDCLYWETLRAGLLVGYADQRKYCLAIIRLSLHLPHTQDIRTPVMVSIADDSKVVYKAYEQYATLFETIVLDRYSNQVQACLPELATLIDTDSKVTPAMATTLLAAALNPRVQDNIRKIIGNWYMGYLIKHRELAPNHIEFVVKGFLPWATQGSLFTSTLTATRTTTVCIHGATLAEFIAMFVANSPDMLCRSLILEILQFVLDAGGRLFQYSILYLLEGLNKGLALRTTTHISLEPADLDLILRVSRLTGLPEIAGDLYGLYCKQLCDYVSQDTSAQKETASYKSLYTKILHLETHPLASGQLTPCAVDGLPPLQSFLQQLYDTKHCSIQGDSYASACKTLIQTLDRADATLIKSHDMYAVLDALWEEADRREFSRSVAVNMPALFFHPVCIKICILQDAAQSESDGSLTVLLTRAMECLQRLSESRPYLLSVLAMSLRKAVFSSPSITSILPFEEYILRFVNHPPTVKTEFLFEVAAAEKLQKFVPHRDYAFYYGQREWHAYAAVLDLLCRFPEDQSKVAKRILDHLLEPWKEQKAPIPIISKWKDVLQLQAMLLLTDFCIPDTQVDMYLDAFTRALVVEQWPRYRFLLEWIVARIYYRFPSKAIRILNDLEKLDEGSPIHVASLVKVAALVAPYLDSENFALNVLIRLIPFSASPKVHIRHEAHWCFPIVFDLATSNDWKSITGNPAFVALDKHIRGMDKFGAPAWSIRTLKLDSVKDFTLTGIFQGQYLSIETPEQKRVAHEDFVELQDKEKTLQTNLPLTRIALGWSPTLTVATLQDPETQASPQSSLAPTFLQTKSGFDFASLYPHSGPPHVKSQRPASVILIASLIDNPTNLGGLSRISESFGLEALYIDDLKKLGHKDFKATSVTSEKHLPIHELKAYGVPNFLLEMKRKGYAVVGIEQTDRSGMLGDEGKDSDADTKDAIYTTGSRKDSGTLPQKCVLVLGSEKGGITAEVLAVVDRCVEIRTVGVTRSLNVQTAGGIAVYEWWRLWHDDVLGI
ncbi:hypothetical protein P153DRAFT_78529 [Dothidotthia symphoricarpi CBS 119687]|uniref:tRNA/rRNA methyltransferase SpoU type domain-containing protein n=1 Tax=Dothidotthia symphoricarpi CBS 119687 TaxID=1392245 RepID=A0A6A6A6S7_9PLEO|nr:uncharacterized protein P153DRAFT_78529 [Dothidotthia symphoricarpi CBS 119687]KAF2126478.1 hypothetical protein P153DRAFT_78529 [Dothidotthia symphoricarpi CBS 119687]